MEESYALIKVHGKNSQGYAAVSVQDEERCNKHRWHDNGNGYVRTTINKKMVRMHQFVTGKKHMDHVNHDAYDNRRSNLFAGGQSENNRNVNKKTPTSTSQYPGVNWHKQHNKWQVRIQINKKKHHLGYFENELEAAHTYYTVAKQQHPLMQHPSWATPRFIAYQALQNIVSLIEHKHA